MKMMDYKRKIYLNKEIRCGGFYELSIQVCPSLEMQPIKEYTDYIWAMSKVEGPFDEDFNKASVNLENFVHNGILNLDQHSIPFKTYNIRESEPIQIGYNWFDICFYTAAIEKVFGEQYRSWGEEKNIPKPLENFLYQTMISLYKIYPFKLAMIDFEISGIFYLEDLGKQDLENWTSTTFYVGRSSVDTFLDKYKKYIQIID